MQWMQYRQVSRTILIALGCGAFLGGLGLTVLEWRVPGTWLMVAAVLLVICKKRLLVISIPAVIIAGLIIGLWRGGDMQQQLAQYVPFIGQKIVLIGEVSEDPTFDDKGQLDLRLTHVRIDGREVPGEVRVKSFAPLSLRRGDVLQAKGKLYDGFGNYQASMYYAELSIMSHNINVVEDTRRHFAAAVYNTVPEPQASLGLGFLLGIKSQLPDNLDDQLKLLGLTHIVVASGYNLTILIRLAKRLFQKRSAYQTVAVAGALIAAFLAVTGFSPSMSRAALVAGIALAAWYYGRRVHPVILLLCTAAVTAGINPLYLWNDIGWWLSFLAFAGVMLLAPLLQRRIFYDKEPRLFGQIIIETISAQLLTLPLIIWIFGDLPLLSVLANVLTAPLVPLAMLLTFIAGLGGLALGAVGGYVALPATWLLTFITDMVGLMARVPWASVPYQVGLPIMLGVYGTFLLVGLLLWRKTKYDYLSSSIIE